MRLSCISNCCGFTSWFFPQEYSPPVPFLAGYVMQILTTENTELYILLPTVPALVRSSTDLHMYPALFCSYRISLLQSLKWSSIMFKKHEKKKKKKTSIELQGDGNNTFSYCTLGQFFLTVNWKCRDTEAMNWIKWNSGSTDMGKATALTPVESGFSSSPMLKQPIQP